MRYSNLLFGKGSIIFCRYPANSDKAFLNGRPLIVVSNPTSILRTITVCLTGTQDKPGISASFYNHLEREYVGGAKVSTIYPYYLYTIHIDYVVSTIGQLDPYIMREVDDAIDFHLGRNMKVPGYLINHDEYLFSVTYQQAQDKHLPREYLNRDFCEGVPMKRSPRKAVNDNSLSQEVDEKSSLNNVISAQVIDQWISDTNAAAVNVSEISTDQTALVNLMDEQSVSFIVSRIVPISLISRRYKCNRPVANTLRLTLTNMAMTLAKDTLNSMSGLFSSTEVEKIPDFVIVGMILLRTFFPNDVTGDYQRYLERMDECTTKYRINTEDRRIWRACDSIGY